LANNSSISLYGSLKGVNMARDVADFNWQVIMCAVNRGLSIRLATTRRYRRTCHFPRSLTWRHSCPTHGTIAWWHLQLTISSLFQTQCYCCPVKTSQFILNFPPL